MKITPVHRLQGWALSTYAGLVWRTASFQTPGQEHMDGALAAGRPVIIAAWHGMTLMLAGYLVTHLDRDRLILVVPDDSRGAALSVWARRQGMHPFVISMEANSLVAARRLLGLIRQMKPGIGPSAGSSRPRAGMNLYLNPDGPDGPSREPKSGIVFIARRAGALIVPTGAFTATGYRIPRWDRYIVPFPFSRIAVVVGEPLDVPAEADLEQARVALRERLNEAERAAELLYRTGAVSI